MKLRTKFTALALSTFGLALLHGCGGDDEEDMNGAAGMAGTPGTAGEAGTPGTAGEAGTSAGGTPSTGGTAGTGGEAAGEAGMAGAAGMAGMGPTTFTVRIENVSDAFMYLMSGVFNTPVDADDPGGAGPGASYQFEFDAPPGSRLSFATMFVESNDFFYAPAQDGLPLFNEDGDARSGDITDEVFTWDAGTEVNQTLGEGADQPMQGGAETGDPDPNSSVRMAQDEDLPAVDEVIAVMLESDGLHFTVTIENISGDSSLPTAIAPGVFVIHDEDQTPLFEDGEDDFGMGLEALAEDGNPADLGDSLAAVTGLASPLAPGVWALTGSAENLLYEEGAPDFGDGLESLAEDGNPAGLAGSLADELDEGRTGVFNTPDGADAPGAAVPGGAYEFEVTAMPGDFLHFATMLVRSNDFFFGPADTGLALWDDEGNPIDGDITEDVMLWNAGTEVDEPLGAGPNQAPFQGGDSNIGPDENGDVAVVDTPPASDQVMVTISAE